jgi:uncharacterized protein YqeY
MIKEKIQKEILVSLKQKKETDLKVLRFLLSSINYAEIAKGKALTDEEIISLFQKELKKRKEAIEMFKKAKRMEIVADEEKQLAIIQAYLPVQMSQEELEIIINGEIKKINGVPNIGQVIGLVMAQVKGKADGSLVSALVRQKLS